MICGVLIMLPSILFSCVVPYQQKGIMQGGWSTSQIDNNTFRVSYVGAPRDKVDIYDLYRCAELTVEQGADYFIVVERGGDIHCGEARPRDPR